MSAGALEIWKAHLRAHDQQSTTRQADHPAKDTGARPVAGTGGTNPATDHNCGCDRLLPPNLVVFRRRSVTALFGLNYLICVSLFAADRDAVPYEALAIVKNTFWRATDTAR